MVWCKRLTESPLTIEPQHPGSAENLLLARLPVHERNAILRGSKPVSCASGNVLLSAGTHSEYVFFPVDMVVSTVRTLRDGRSIDVGVVGGEGMVGLDVFVDARTQLDDAVVQIAGTAYCMPADDLRKQFQRRGILERSLLRFTNAFLSQVAQTAVCTRFHDLDSRLARWLLLIHDRSAHAEIRDTPFSVARALGVEDGEAERSLTRLASAKAIRQRRKSVTVTGPDALELIACECYETIRQVYERTTAS